MRTRLTTNLRAAGTGTCPDAKAVQTLADDYARNAARFYEREDCRANSHDYFMPVWSCARDEEAKLEGLAWTLFLPGYLDGLGVKYDIDNLKVGDGAALAEWITTQLAADRIWGTPAYCAGVVEPRPFPTRHAESEVIRMLHSLSVRVEEGFYALTYDAQRSVVVKTLIGAFLYDPLGQFPPIPFGPAEPDAVDKANEQLCGRGQEHLVPLRLDALEGPDGIFVHDDFDSLDEWLAHLHARLQEQSSSTGSAS